MDENKGKDKAAAGQFQPVDFNRVREVLERNVRWLLDGAEEAAPTVMALSLYLQVCMQMTTSPQPERKG